MLLACVVALGCQGDDDVDSAPASSAEGSTQPSVQIDGAHVGDGVAVCEALDVSAIEPIAGVGLSVRGSDNSDEVNGSISCLLERAGLDHPDGTSYFFVYLPDGGPLPGEEATSEILGRPAIVDQPSQQLVVDLGDGVLVQVRRGVPSAGADAWHPDRELVEDELRRLGEVAVEAHRAAGG